MVKEKSDTSPLQEQLLFEWMSKETLFENLSGTIWNINELHTMWVHEPQLYRKVRTIIKELFEARNISAEELRKIHYISFLIDRYAELDRDWERSDSTWWHWNERISHEMWEIWKTLNMMWLDTKWNMLKSPEVIEQIKGLVDWSIKK